MLAFDKNGNVIWRYITGGRIDSAPAIGSDGTLYFGSFDTNLYAIKSDGTLKWKFNADAEIWGSPSLGADGAIYFGTTDQVNFTKNFFYAIKPDGSLKWKHDSGAGNCFYWCTPTISKDGTIYMTRWSGPLHAYQPDGTLKLFSQDFTATFASSPAINDKGILYLAATSGELLAIDSGSTNGMGETAWPKIHHDIHNTGSIQRYQVSTQSLRFTGVQPGSSGTKTFTITNSGSSELAITSITSNNPVFTVAPSPFTISAGSSAEVTVTFAPTDDIACQGAISLLSAGGVGTVVVKGGSVSGEQKWKFTAEGSIASVPALGVDGTIYFGSDDTNLYAINPDGSLKWKYKADGPIHDSPTVGINGNIYVGSFDTYIYCISPQGGLIWRFKTNDIVRSTPAIAADGTVYVGSLDKNLYALDAEGNLKWKYEAGDGVLNSPVIGVDGTVYFGSWDSYIYAVNNDGTLKWKYKTDEKIWWSSAALGSGALYIGSHDGCLYALRYDGTFVWKYQTGGLIGSSPAIGSDGTIYFESADNYFYALQSDGTFKWRFQTNNSGYGCHPTIGRDGTIYVGSSDGFLYAINPDGSLKWNHQEDQLLTTGAALAEDGTIYSASWSGSAVYALDSGTAAGLSHSPWPKFHYDSLNSGRTTAGSENYSLLPSSLRFTGIQPGSSGTKTFTITNNGSSELAITSITSNNPLFTVNPSSLTIAAGSSSDVSVIFSPTDDMACQGAISLQSAGGVGTVQVKGGYVAGELVWKFETNASMDSSPAIGADGTIYIGSWNNYLYALNPDGSEKWKYLTNARFAMSSPAIGLDGTVYFGTDDGTFYALAPDMTLKWKYQIGTVIRSCPAIGLDGTIYVGSNSIYAFNPDGTLKWQYTPELGVMCSSLALDACGGLYFGTTWDVSRSYFYALNPDGLLKWRYFTGNMIESSPAIGKDGTIYVGCEDGYLYAFNSDGTLKWKYDNKGTYGSSPVIGADGTIYSGFCLSAINPDGSVKWSNLPAFSGNGTSVIGENGIIYFVNIDGKISAINSDGSIKWEYRQSSQFGMSSATISNNGILYVGTMDGIVLAINTGTNAGLADSPWPKYHRMSTILEVASNIRLCPIQFDSPGFNPARAVRKNSR